MCLGIPGQIKSISENGKFTRVGLVDFGGIAKEINLSYVPEANIGEYVIVHVGFAISQIDEKEATRVFEYLKEMDDLQELENFSEKKKEPL